ncbi:MAG: 4Fe-4S binding protein [Rhodocyclales bacterium]|nr:4Fe-4S binding protein [Rhodocyclales bacterium]
MQTASITLYPRRPTRRTRLARLGDWMARHRRAILAVQWLIVAFYLVLVALPAFLPHPHPEARLFSSDFGATSAIDRSICTTGIPAPTDKAAYLACWQDRLVLLAQYLFWGVWWPFVILSIMLMGRVWCGVLCPEGALTEFASRHGRGGRIPRWLRWSGWPLVAFVLTTVYGQLISVYEYPQAALLILGGSTVAAVAIGWLYGKGKRVWCRYLCPVSGVFALLARLAPIHFKVDRAVWNRHPQRTAAVDCAPLLSVSHLSGMSQCHACGRCSGHRDAVTLTARSPNAEILGGPPYANPPDTAHALLLMFGMLGVAIGAFQWTVNPWFVKLKQFAADWLVNRDAFWMLEESPAWWLLTRYPDVNDIFTWLDGAAILAWIAGVALALGGSTLLAVKGAAKLAGLDWRRLALGLVPLAGIGLFLGLSMMSATHLRAEGLALGWLPGLRAGLLAVGLLWSLTLGVRLIKVGAGSLCVPGIPLRGQATAAKCLAALIWLLPLAAIGSTWVMTFFSL